MKRSPAVLLTVLLILGSITFTACGEQKKNNTSQKSNSSLVYRYASEYSDLEEGLSIYQDNAYVCEIPGYTEGEVYLPDEYEGKPIVAVFGKDDAINQVTALTVGNEVRYIENLGSTSGLEQLTLSSSVEVIANSFQNCSSLGEVAFPESIDKIDQSFTECSALETLALEKGHLGSVRDSFNNCSALRSVSIGADVDNLNHCFVDCPELQELKLTGAVTVIGKSFVDADKLTEVTIEQNMTNLTDSFNQCGSLRSITFKGTVDNVNRSCNDCTSLEKVVFLKAVQAIFNSFNGCSSLIYIDLNGVEKAENSFTDSPVIPELPTSTPSEPVDQLANALNKDGMSVSEDLGKELNEQSDRYQTVFDHALQKLADSGAIPALSDDEKMRIQFDKGEEDENGDRLDTVAFSDANAEARLTAAPDFTLDNVVVMDCGEIGSMQPGYIANSLNFGFDNNNCETALENITSGKVKDVFASSYNDCKYLLYAEKYYSEYYDDYYVLYGTGLRKPVDRADLTYVAFIVDMEKEEIVHVHSLYTTIPDDDYVKKDQAGWATRMADTDGVVYIDPQGYADSYFIELLFLPQS